MFKKLLSVAAAFLFVVTGCSAGAGKNSSQQPEELLPENTAVLLDVPIVCQHPEYPTGCESIALYMLLRYYDTAVSPEDIVEALPKGPVPYTEDGETYGANPEREFVGDPRDANSYGVFHGPIRSTAELFRPGAKAEMDATLERIHALLDAGSPMVAWYTTDEKNGIRYGHNWLDKQTGERILWPHGEHAVVVCGYTDDALIINDPDTGAQRSVKNDLFMTWFTMLGGRIVYYEA